MSHDDESLSTYEYPSRHRQSRRRRRAATSNHNEQSYYDEGITTRTLILLSALMATIEWLYSNHSTRLRPHFLRTVVNPVNVHRQLRSRVRSFTDLHPSPKAANQSYSFVAEGNNNMKFTLPPSNDLEYIYQLPSKPAFMADPRKRVRYMRNSNDIITRGNQGDCSNVMEVLGWIMDEVNDEEQTMMIAYDTLMHLHKEKDFVVLHKEDIDIDTLATIDTVRFLGNLESELFHQFGWTTRVYLNDMGYVVFMQIFCTCGHTPIMEKTGKIIANESAIEVRPLLQSIPNDEEDGIYTPIVKDIWQGSSYFESMLFPPQHVRFESSAAASDRDRPLNLQIPNKPYELLNSFYGDDWMKKTPSSSSSVLASKRGVEISNE